MHFQPLILLVVDLYFQALPTAFGMDAISPKLQLLFFTVVLGSFVVVGTKGVDKLNSRVIYW